MVRYDVMNSYHRILTIDYYKFDFYYKFWLVLFNTRVRIVQLREHNIEIALPSNDGSAPKLYNVCRWRSLFRMHKVPLPSCPAPTTTSHR